MEKPRLTYIDELSGGDLEFKSTILSVLKKELPQELERYCDAIKERQLSKASEIVHKIKHKISILGLEEGHATATLLENELKEGIMTDNHLSFVQLIKTMLEFLDTIN